MMAEVREGSFVSTNERLLCMQRDTIQEINKATERSFGLLYLYLTVLRFSHDYLI